MGSATLVLGPRLGIALAVLTLVAAGTAAATGLGYSRQIAVASVRAILQLAAVSLVIAAVVASLPLATTFVLVMLAIAALTSGRRITGRRGWWAAAPIAAGAVPIIAGLIAGGLVPPRGIAIVPMAGILIGGAMTATSLAGRRATDELAQRWGEYEAALALGFLPRDAAMLVIQPAAAQALIPALDQTRTVGLVTLPGAYVGVLLGGASPLAAGATQVLVLVGLLAAESIAVAATAELVARGLLRRAPARPRRRNPLRALTRRLPKRVPPDRP
ncbi:MAG: UDP-glucose/iron transport system permease protein [Cryptosporangiaceae bacterium]|nr:UDP-glucose/iron transport system permease protein [Cryptosporangiaceae bacterium]